MPLLKAAVLAAVAACALSDAPPPACSQDPCVKPKTFDCPMRALALRFAVQLAGSAGSGNTTAMRVSVASALNLSACPGEAAKAEATWRDDGRARARVGSVSSGDFAPTAIYVAASKGSDRDGDGSVGKPFATVQRAQLAARVAGPGASVVVRAGTYYFTEPLVLSNQDSHTSYSAYPGEVAVLSGGRDLTGLRWQPWTPESGAGQGQDRRHRSGGSGADACSMTIHNHTACTRNPYRNLTGPGLTVATCCASCDADPECNAFTLHGNGAMCLFSMADNAVHPSRAGDIVCGTKQPLPPPDPPGPAPPPPEPYAPTFVTDVPANLDAQEMYFAGLRQWPARYPNGDPSKPQDGYCNDGKPVPPPKGSNPTALPLNVNVSCYGGPTPASGLRPVAAGSMEPLDQSFSFSVPCGPIPRPTSAVNDGLLRYGPLLSPPTYTGGALKRFSPPLSFWPSTVPVGLTGVSRAVSMNWSRPEHWRVHAYHPASWGNWGFDVDASTIEAALSTGRGGDGATITFRSGGNQEARGGGGMGSRYFANILEELDSANEFYYDGNEGKLYWAPPVRPPLPADGLVLPQLDRLVVIAGASAANPVVNVSVRGFVMRHTRPTFCCDDPYESVSGGDWSIHRGGMVFVENASKVEIAQCTLDSPGGNGVFLSGHADGVDIHHNEIARAGDSLVAAAGVTRLMDGRDATHPRNCTVHHNYLHHWGVWGKQTSAYFGAMTRDIHVTNNVIHDGPRAGINQNDGFAGGSEFAYNLVLNTVLDTGDHGNFNSWDRKPWIWLADGGGGGGGPNPERMVPNQHHIHHNFIVRTSFNGPSNNLYCLDHDDGSSMYNDTFNFLVYGGVKFREGLSKHAHGNLLAYPNGPDQRQVPFADQVKGTNNSFVGNTIVTGTGQFYGSCAGYKARDPSDHVDIDDNSLYSPGKAFSDGGCAGDGTITSFSKWQSEGLGQDQHSTLSDASALPDAALLAAAAKLLGIESAE